MRSNDIKSEKTPFLLMWPYLVSLVISSLVLLMEIKWYTSQGSYFTLGPLPIHAYNFQTSLDLRLLFGLIFWFMIFYFSLLSFLFYENELRALRGIKRIVGVSMVGAIILVVYSLLYVTLPTSILPLEPAPVVFGYPLGYLSYLTNNPRVWTSMVSGTLRVSLVNLSLDLAAYLFLILSVILFLMLISLMVTKRGNGRNHAKTSQTL